MSNQKTNWFVLNNVQPTGLQRFSICEKWDNIAGDVTVYSDCGQTVLYSVRNATCPDIEVSFVLGQTYYFTVMVPTLDVLIPIKLESAEDPGSSCKNSIPVQASDFGRGQYMSPTLQVAPFWFVISNVVAGGLYKIEVCEDWDNIDANIQLFDGCSAPAFLANVSGTCPSITMRLQSSAPYYIRIDKYVGKVLIPVKVTKLIETGLFCDSPIPAESSDFTRGQFVPTGATYWFVFQPTMAASQRMTICEDWDSIQGSIAVYEKCGGPARSTAAGLCPSINAFYGAHKTYLISVTVAATLGLDAILVPFKITLLSRPTAFCINAVPLVASAYTRGQFYSDDLSPHWFAFTAKVNARYEIETCEVWDQIRGTLAAYTNCTGPNNRLDITAGICPTLNRWIWAGATVLFQFQPTVRNLLIPIKINAIAGSSCRTAIQMPSTLPVTMYYQCDRRDHLYRFTAPTTAKYYITSCIGQGNNAGQIWLSSDCDTNKQLYVARGSCPRFPYTLTAGVSYIIRANHWDLNFTIPIRVAYYPKQGPANSVQTPGPEETAAAGGGASAQGDTDGPAPTEMPVASTPAVDVTPAAYVTPAVYVTRAADATQASSRAAPSVLTPVPMVMTPVAAYVTPAVYGTPAADATPGSPRAAPSAVTPVAVVLTPVPMVLPAAVSPSAAATASTPLPASAASTPATAAVTSSTA